MNLLVFAEVRDGKLKKSSLETLSEAVRLSKPLGGKVGVALVGEGIKAHAVGETEQAAARGFERGIGGLAVHDTRSGP